MTEEADLTIAPVGTDRWADLVALFGPDRGAYGRCWCMFWRVTGRQFDALGGDGRRSAFHDRVVAHDNDAPPAGLLAYDNRMPVGWIAIAPRAEFGRINRSPLLKPVDDTPVWSITCLYVHPDRRRRGITGRLIDAASTSPPPTTQPQSRPIPSTPTAPPTARSTPERSTCSPPHGSSRSPGDTTVRSCVDRSPADPPTARNRPTEQGA